jgi:anti-sigma regulatory factor (Ser/Thr protein kinase)
MPRLESARASHLRAITPPRVPVLKIELDAVAESGRLLRRLVRDFASSHGAGGVQLSSIVLAVSEAVSNVVVHAYPDGETGFVRLTADIEEDALEIVIADDGQGFRPGTSDRLGIGLAVIAGSAADFAISHGEEGTEVWMRFLLRR